MNDVKQYILAEKYRPKTLDDCILPEGTKKEFNDFKQTGSIPNLLLVGPQGTGKTTTALALIKDLGADAMIINASLKGDIDTLRTTISQYASSISFTEGRKFVILDEADYLTHNTQPALRNFMEEFSSNCGFILTANYPNRIIKELRSRVATIDFKIPTNERSNIARQYMERVCLILKQEAIPYEKEAVAQLIKMHFPDLRKVLNEIQRYSARGSIDSGIFASFNEESWDELFASLKSKNFTAMRKWVGSHSDIDSNTIFTYMYDNLPDKLKPISIPTLILLLGEYQFKAVSVINQEINLAACFTEVMSNVEFK